jgi:hypothetical protein
MALYKTDFSEYAIDDQPSDWTERWLTTYGSAVVKAVDGGIGGKSLYLVSAIANYYGLSWNDCGTPGDVELLVRGKRNNSSGDVLHVFARGSGTTSRNFYHLCQNGSVCKFAKNVASAYTLLGSWNKCEELRWVWIRFRIQGSALKVKIWYDGDQEPAAWDREVTDASLSSGWVGVGGYSVGNTYFDWFAAETDSGAWPIVAPYEIKNIALDLSAWGQKIADFGSYLRAHDGIELYDLKAELSTWGLVEEDLLTWLAAYYQSMDDFGANLETWATSYKNLAGDYDVKGQKMEALITYLTAAKSKFKDLKMFLSVANGSVLRDMAAYLAATNGIVAKDFGMYLQALSAVPAFKSVTAHRINSVIHEAI